MQNRENYTIYRPIFAGKEDILVPLRPTGKTIETVTSTSELMADPMGSTFVKKQTTDTDIEAFQLWFLRKAGIFTPKVFMPEHKNNESFATKWGGTPLAELWTTLDEQETKQILGITGLKLHQIHSILATSPLPSERVQTTYQPSAHIVDTFFYKFLLDTPHKTSLESYRISKKNQNMTGLISQQNFSTLLKEGQGKFIKVDRAHPRHIDGLLQFFSKLAGHYFLQLQPYVMRQSNNQELSLQIGDHQLFYGDFKPENILASQTQGQWHLAFIDPVISRGNIYFDLAKFTSRYLLDNLLLDDKRKYIGSFFYGYGTIPLPELKLYGPYTFIDLLIIDRLNIFKAYLNRYDHQDSSYRFVQQLESQAFCNALIDEVSLLINIKDRASFDHYFLKNL